MAFVFYVIKNIKLDKFVGKKCPSYAFRCGASQSTDAHWWGESVEQANPYTNIKAVRVCKSFCSNNIEEFVVMGTDGSIVPLKDF